MTALPLPGSIISYVVILLPLCFPQHISYSLPSPPLQALYCTNPNCTIHRQSLETYCKSLCKTLKDSAELTLPLSRQGHIIPGWNNAAALLKSKANFWHKVWKEAGSPCSGVLFDIKHHSR